MSALPHILIEYSANLEDSLAVEVLVRRVHEAVIATGVFAPGGVRTRAVRREVFLVADGDPGNAFVATVVRIGRGRDAATRRRVAETILEAVAQETATAFRSRGLALSVDVEEIDPAASLKRNNLHHRLAACAGPAAAAPAPGASAPAPEEG